MPKILIADDDEPTVKLIEMVVSREEGFELFEARSGQDALAVASEIQPDLIVLDIMMPGMSGIEVCRAIRAGETNPDVPILMFTAKVTMDDKLASFDAGADDFLTKPVKPEEFMARVRALLARKRPAVSDRAAPEAPRVSVLAATVSKPDDALQIAKLRLAKGEISIDEFEEIRRVISEAETAVAPGPPAADAGFTREPAPAPSGGPDVPSSESFSGTNQQVLDALYAVLSRRGMRDQLWDYIVTAGLAPLTEHRGEHYQGRAIADLPGLDDDIKADLLALLGG